MRNGRSVTGTVAAGAWRLDLGSGPGHYLPFLGRPVVAADPAVAMVAEARHRHREPGVAAVACDAEALPFPDSSFDVVLSTCGAMFAPDQEQIAAEPLQVCRPGGRIGMVNWTPGRANAYPSTSCGAADGGGPASLSRRPSSAQSARVVARWTSRKATGEASRSRRNARCP